MRSLFPTLLFIVLISCQTDYPNPDIRIRLNVPFYLRNTPTVQTPDNNTDRAVYRSEKFKSEVVVTLDTVEYYTCISCKEVAVVPRATLSVNGRQVFLTDLPEDSRSSESAGFEFPPFRLTLLEVENYANTKQSGSQGSYRLVKLVLSEI